MLKRSQSQYVFVYLYIYASVTSTVKSATVSSIRSRKYEIHACYIYIVLTYEDVNTLYYTI